MKYVVLVTEQLSTEITVVDAETGGEYFYEEVQSARRAELIVEAWNHLYGWV